MNQQEWDREAEKNASRISEAVKDFETKYTPTFLGGEVDFRSLKDDAGGLRAMFKGTTLKRELREELWAQVNKIITAAFDARTAMFQRRDEQSAQKREGIEPILNDALAYATAGRGRDDYMKSKNLLEQAMGMMKNGWDGYGAVSAAMHISEGKLNKADREALWQKVLEVKEAQRRSRERAEAEFQAKHERWVQGGRDKIARLRDARSRKHDQIANLQAQISHLQDKLANAWSDDYIAQIQDWISEKESAIRDVESEIDDIDRKINEIEREISAA